MLNNTVILKKCCEYDYGSVYQSVESSIKHLGGIEKFIKPGNKVLIKPNLIIAKPSDKMATTHPFVVKAVCEIVSKAGGIITVADSPGGLYNKKILEKTYKVTGLTELENENGVSLNYNVESSVVDANIDHVKRKFDIIEPYLTCDVVINLPKLKTHVMSNYTGAVKNLYGLIPGTTKAEYHFKYPNKDDFFNLIGDLCHYIKPQLNIMDAIYMMEGDGPSNGVKRHLGLILASENPFALDMVGHKIIGYEPNEVFTSLYGIKHGLIPKTIDELQIVGEDYREYIITDLLKPNITTTTFEGKAPGFLIKIAKQLFTPYPKFDKDLCVKCGNCVASCPAKILKFHDKKPVFINKNNCIKCYCCHEMCPQNAVKLRKLPKLFR